MRTPSWQFLGKLLFWVFSRIWAPIMAVGWPILVIYGMAQSRVNDVAAMNIAAGETPYLVGVASVRRSDQRSYLLARRVLKEDGLLVVHDGDGQLSTETKAGSAFRL